MNENVIVISPTLGMVSMAPITIPDLSAIMCSALTGAVLQTLENIPDSDTQTKVAEELFDIMNYNFTKCLENCFPDQELRSDISAEAILETENRILVERASEAEGDK